LDNSQSLNGASAYRGVARHRAGADKMFLTSAIGF
jgi:hypothetical protein